MRFPTQFDGDDDTLGLWLDSDSLCTRIAVIDSEKEFHARMKEEVEAEAEHQDSKIGDEFWANARAAAPEETRGAQHKGNEA